MERLPWCDEVDEVVATIRTADWRDRDALKAKLLALVFPQHRNDVVEYLRACKRDQPLEVRWEIEEVLEELAPVVPVEEEAEVEEELIDPNKPLSMSDLTLVFDDPRGLMLYREKVGEEWYASQVNPNTGQSQLFKITPDELAHLKTQLEGSPYWVLGAGGIG